MNQNTITGFPTPDRITLALPEGRKLYVRAMSLFVKLENIASRGPEYSDPRRALACSSISELYNIHNNAPSIPPLSPELSILLKEADESVKNDQLYVDNDANGFKKIDYCAIVDASTLISLIVDHGTDRSYRPPVVELGV